MYSLEEKKEEAKDKADLNQAAGDEQTTQVLLENKIVEIQSDPKGDHGGDEQAEEEKKEVKNQPPKEDKEHEDVDSDIDLI